MSDELHLEALIHADNSTGTLRACESLNWDQLLEKGPSLTVPIRLVLDDQPAGEPATVRHVVQTAILASDNEDLGQQLAAIFTYSESVWTSVEDWHIVVGEQPTEWIKRSVLLSRPFFTAPALVEGIGKSHQTKLVELPDGEVIKLYALWPRRMMPGNPAVNPLKVVSGTVILIALAEILAQETCVQDPQFKGYTDDEIAVRLTTWLSAHGGTHLPPVSKTNVQRFRADLKRSNSAVPQDLSRFFPNQKTRWAEILQIRTMPEEQ